MEGIKKHPEWKQLMALIEPLIAVDRTFDYGELREMLGLDVRTDRGRSQFRRFEREALKEWRVAFECVRNVGYRVVTADEHNVLALRQMRKSQRRLRHGLRLVTMVRDEELTTHGRAINDDMRCRIARQISFGRKEIKGVLAASDARHPVPRPMLAVAQ